MITLEKSVTIIFCAEKMMPKCLSVMFDIRSENVFTLSW